MYSAGLYNTGLKKMVQCGTSIHHIWGFAFCKDCLMPFRFVTAITCTSLLRLMQVLHNPAFPDKAAD
jgi:hypothetical protein